MFLLAIAGTITIAGVTYYAATEVIEEIRNRDTYNYYAAVLNNDEVYIAGPYLYDQLAFDAVKAGNNIFAITDAKAQEAARKGGCGVTYGSEVHGQNDGWWPHYHPMYKVPATGNLVKLNPHCWF